MTIHHAALETLPQDRDALVAFFALLGFEEVEVPEGLREIARWVERDGTQIHILFADETVVPPDGHVAVVAPDYEDTVARLRQADHDIDERPPYWGSPRCFVTAPGGHQVEVMEFTPPPRRWLASP